jgi:Xaa-Pro dipeptidase
MDKERYLTRIGALQALEQANAVDCVALVPGANLHYFTGLAMKLSERPAVALIPAEARSESRAVLALVLPALEAPAAREHLPPGASLFSYSDEEGHEHAFFRAAEALDLKDRVPRYAPFGGTAH